MTRNGGRAAALAAVAVAVVLAGCAAGSTAGTPRAAAHASAATTSATSSASRVTAPSVAHPTPRPARPAAPNPCAANSASQLVRVNVTAQHLWMCAAHRTVYSAPVTTGIVGVYTSTPTGTYVVQAKITDTRLTLISGATYPVKYWIPFDGPLFGFHDSSWQDFPYGSARYRTEGSHGCVHVPLAAIRFLYHWAAVGTSVRIEP